MNANSDGLGTIPLITDFRAGASNKQLKGGRVPQFIHVKRDGHMLRLRKNDMGQVVATTRRPTDITHEVRYLPWFHNFMRLAPIGTSLLGELWYPGGDRSSIKTALKKQSSALMFEVFGHEGLEVGRDLRHVEANVVGFGMKFMPYYMGYNFKDLQALESWMCGIEMSDHNVEGFVFNNGNLDILGKWKPECTIDLVVTGTRDAKDTGKYCGLVGSLLVSALKANGCFIELAAISGMTDNERDYITKHEYSSIGRVVEVAYQTVGAKGRLVHPRFKRWRDDKKPEQCGLVQDPRLIKYWVPESE